mmetsp:Transcript_16237/g.20598  ORF Transcript_16237/g.20598 Transcript_16237/m.20598 type:complete len:175 (-) Transcript_16237:703-1227(-)
MWTLQRTGARVGVAQVGVGFHRRFSSDILDMASVVRKHALEPQTSTSLQTMMRTGRGEFLHKTYRDAAWKKDDKVATERVLMQVAGFLRHELPIRLAHRILDLEQVPLLRDAQSVQAVKDLYTTSFLDLLSVPQKVSSKREEAAFADIVENIYERHAGVLVQMVSAFLSFSFSI